MRSDPLKYPGPPPAQNNPGPKPSPPSIWTRLFSVLCCNAIDNVEELTDKPRSQESRARPTAVNLDDTTSKRPIDGQTTREYGQDMPKASIRHDNLSSGSNNNFTNNPSNNNHHHRRPLILDKPVPPLPGESAPSNTNETVVDGVARGDSKVYDIHMKSGHSNSGDHGLPHLLHHHYHSQEPEREPDQQHPQTLDQPLTIESHDPQIPDHEQHVDIEKGQISDQIQALDSMNNFSSDGGLIPPSALLPPVGAGGATGYLLNPLHPDLLGRKCLVLDLDETLVHSSFKYIHQADFVIPVEIEAQYHNVYVIKRPGVDEFMKRVGQLYEVVVFTASVAKYGDPLLDQLDVNNVVHHRLFRESCYNHQGNYIKNLSQLGRPLKDVIIIDNSPASYIFHPQHAVPVSSWFSDVHDNELLDMIPFLEDLAKETVEDVSIVLDVICD